ncbi:Maltose permease MAL31 [Madurella mycetomatis]|uniref:Maltose permease MAL31 n=1 Tax=Madurella mycetomatis TaxID=100816 RepID=A0A175VPY0_9PEZI|nr:Maltose permease MAL31 [Madurella mycetomatis]
MASRTVQVSHLQKVADQDLEEKLGRNAILEAKQATDDEHAQTLMQALRENHKAVFWSVMISMSIIMEGYDTILIGNFFAYPEFAMKFGEFYGGTTGWQVSAPWQTGLNMASTVGGIFGGLLNGYFASRFGYRWVMIVSMGFLNAFIFVVFFAPNAGTLKSIMRLSGEKMDDQINAQLAMMVHTTKLEAEVTRGATYLDCFRGVDLRHTEICMVAFMGQILSGSSFAYTPTYFFTTAGMETYNAFNLSLGAKGMAFLGTVLSWWLITYFGRRTIYVTGIAILTVVLLIVGVLDVSAGSRGLWPSGGLCVFWLFTYSLTIGPLAYSIISETSSVRLRPLSVVLARTAYQLTNIVSQVLYSYMQNPTAWDFKGKSGFFWGGTAFIVFIWAYFRLPEIKGRTYEELDILFANKIPARKFAKSHVDAYALSIPVEEHSRTVEGK